MTMEHLTNKIRASRETVYMICTNNISKSSV